MEKDMKQFFEFAYKAIEQEDIILRSLFGKSYNNKKLYDNEHNGVCCLYETTFVYLIFKELLKNDFKYKVAWEEPYPSNKGLHSDLALKDDNGKIQAFIEFKIWKENDCKSITDDINKLKTEPKSEVPNKYIFVIGYGGDLEENKTFLEKQNLDMLEEVDEPRSFDTKYWNVKENKFVPNNINFFMYKIK